MAERAGREISIRRFGAQIKQSITNSRLICIFSLFTLYILFFVLFLLMFLRRSFAFVSNFFFRYLHVFLSWHLIKITV